MSKALLAAEITVEDLVNKELSRLSREDEAYLAGIFTTLELFQLEDVLQGQWGRIVGRGAQRPATTIARAWALYFCDGEFAWQSVRTAAEAFASVANHYSSVMEAIRNYRVAYCNFLEWPLEEPINELAATLAPKLGAKWRPAALLLGRYYPGPHEPVARDGMIAAVMDTSGGPDGIPCDTRDLAIPVRDGYLLVTWRGHGQFPPRSSDVGVGFKTDTDSVNVYDWGAVWALVKNIDLSAAERAVIVGQLLAYETGWNY